MSHEIQSIAQRYLRRSNIPSYKYSLLNPAVNVAYQERHSALIKLFSSILFPHLKFLEVGCGYGTNLLELLQLGATPENLVGNELLEDRLVSARRRLPEAIRLLPGDAAQLSLPDASFDVVYQSTVFSSILDDGLQVSLAQKMWELTRRGILWYDFVYDNPSNPDVRGVPVRRIKELFPEGQIAFKKVTLAPPIARRAVPVHPALYNVLNLFPFLRTHTLCFINKA